MTKKEEAKVDYPEQTKEQFKVIHGKVGDWSKAAAAGYRVLFLGYTRSEAAREMEVARQTVSFFLANNLHSHNSNYHYVSMNQIKSEDT